MPKLSTTATVTTTHEITLKPQVKRKLLTELRAYEELETQKDAIKVSMAGHAASIRKLREGTGERSVKIDGFTTTDMSGQTVSKLIVRKLLEQGVTMAQIEAATETKPKKAYELITTPKRKKKPVESEE